MTIIRMLSPETLISLVAGEGISRPGAASQSRLFADVLWPVRDKPDR